jgi:GNAT superfamily N-acetyltransferase
MSEVGPRRRSSGRRELRASHDAFCHPSCVDLTIRSARPEDHEVLLALASRAWEPVFASVNEVLGGELARRLHGEDWRAHHAAGMREILDSGSMRTWVADVDGHQVGFVAARIVDPARRIGEVRIVGVDPAAQRRRIGTALIRHAEVWLHEQGMAVAFIGTGGDPGHTPSRSLYESLGYRLFPSAQYFRVLPDED